MTGMFAVSRAGHDRGRMYLIIKEEGDFVYLVDGKTRKLAYPKKKRKKHVQLIKTDLDKGLLEKLNNQNIIYDEEIKYAVKIRMSKEHQQ